MSRILIGFVATLSATLLYFPGERAGAETALYRELVRKAKAEGEVEHWAAMRKEPAENILKVFSQKFGIKVRYKFWRGTGRQQRTLIEMKAGRPVSADLMSPGREGVNQFIGEGVFRKPPYELLEVWPEIRKEQYFSGGWGLNIFGNSRAIAYNPELVPPELVPKTWDDCARPEFKGKVVLDSRHKLYGLHWNKKEWFLNWVKKMVANEVKLIRGQTDVMQLLAAGAYPLFCSAQPYSAQALIDKGAQNIRIAVPGELLVESGTNTFIHKGAAHPHAAQLLLGWYATEEGQIAADREDYRGFPWVKGTFNAKLAEGNKVLACGSDCLEHAGEMATEYAKALGLPVSP